MTPTCGSGCTVIGTDLGDDLRFDRWCPQFGGVGESLEYRLAPEAPFPLGRALS